MLGLTSGTDGFRGSPMMSIELESQYPTPPSLALPFYLPSPLLPSFFSICNYPPGGRRRKVATFHAVKSIIYGLVLDFQILEEDLKV